MANYLQDDGCICLLQCFLFPSHMIQHKEVPNPLTTEQLEHLSPDEKEQVLNKNDREIDPIYSLFMQFEGEPGKVEK